MLRNSVQALRVELRINRFPRTPVFLSLGLDSEGFVAERRPQGSSRKDEASPTEQPIAASDVSSWIVIGALH
jgi:hypothetical protein